MKLINPESPDSLHPELQVEVVSETEVKNGALRAIDLGVGIELKAYHGGTMYLDDALLAAIVDMVNARKPE